MGSKQQYSVALVGGPPWGFRVMPNPADKGPALISQVLANSRAAQEKVRSGDLILSINGKSIRESSNSEIQRILKRASGILRLQLQKGSGAPVSFGEEETLSERKKLIHKQPTNYQLALKNPPVTQKLGLIDEAAKKFLPNLKNSKPMTSLENLRVTTSQLPPIRPNLDPTTCSPQDHRRWNPVAFTPMADNVLSSINSVTYHPAPISRMGRPLSAAAMSGFIQSAPVTPMGPLSPSHSETSIPLSHRRMDSESDRFSQISEMDDYEPKIRITSSKDRPDIQAMGMKAGNGPRVMGQSLSARASPVPPLAITVSSIKREFDEEGSITPTVETESSGHSLVQPDQQSRKRQNHSSMADSGVVSRSSMVAEPTMTSNYLPSDSDRVDGSGGKSSTTSAINSGGPSGTLPEGYEFRPGSTTSDHPSLATCSLDMDIESHRAEDFDENRHKEDFDAETNADFSASMSMDDSISGAHSDYWKASCPDHMSQSLPTDTECSLTDGVPTSSFDPRTSLNRQNLSTIPSESEPSSELRYPAAFGGGPVTRNGVSEFEEDIPKPFSGSNYPKNNEKSAPQGGETSSMYSNVIRGPAFRVQQEASNSAVWTPRGGTPSSGLTRPPDSVRSPTSQNPPSHPADGFTSPVFGYNPVRFVAPYSGVSASGAVNDYTNSAPFSTTQSDQNFAPKPSYSRPVPPIVQNKAPPPAPPAPSEPAGITSPGSVPPPPPPPPAVGVGIRLKQEPSYVNPPLAPGERSTIEYPEPQSVASLRSTIQNKLSGITPVKSIPNDLPEQSVASPQSPRSPPEPQIPVPPVLPPIPSSSNPPQISSPTSPRPTANLPSPPEHRSPPAAASPPFTIQQPAGSIPPVSPPPPLKVYTAAADQRLDRHLPPLTSPPYGEPPRFEKLTNHRVHREPSPPRGFFPQQSSVPQAPQYPAAFQAPESPRAPPRPPLPMSPGPPAVPPSPQRPDSYTRPYEDYRGGSVPVRSGRTPPPSGSILLERKSSVEGNQVRTDSYYALPKDTASNRRPVRPQDQIKNNPQSDGRKTPLAQRQPRDSGDYQHHWYKMMYRKLHQIDKNEDPSVLRYRMRDYETPPREHHYSAHLYGRPFYEPEPNPYTLKYKYSDHVEDLDYDRHNFFQPYTAPNLRATTPRAGMRRYEKESPAGRSIRSKSAGRYESGSPLPGEIVKSTPAGEKSYRITPKRIEDYVPGDSSLTRLEDERQRSSSVSRPYYPADYSSRYFTMDNRSSRRRDISPPSQDEVRHWYRSIQAGGEVPYGGLRQPAPERRDFKSPGRSLDRPAYNLDYGISTNFESSTWAQKEDLLEEERRKRQEKEIEDQRARRHGFNPLPSKSPGILPSDRFDGLLDSYGRSEPPDEELRGVAKAVYSFTAHNPREISFDKGDLLRIRRIIDQNWYEGEFKGRVGIIPVNYVEMAALAEPESGLSYTEVQETQEGQAKASYNFEGRNINELSLKKGEYITLTKRIDNNWFEGKNAAGRLGIFPSNYVQVLREPSSHNKNYSAALLSSFDRKTPIRSEDPLSSGSKLMVNGLPMDTRDQPKYNSTSIISGGPLPGSQSTAFPPPVSHGHAMSSAATTTHYSTHAPHTGGGSQMMSRGVEFSSRDHQRTPTMPKTSGNHGLDVKVAELRHTADKLGGISGRIPQNADTYTTVYSYKPQNPDELELREGDIVYVVEKCDDGWFIGTSLRTGMFGTFPGNYVQLMM